MHEFSWCAAGHRENVRALVRVGNDIRDHLRSPSSRHPRCPPTVRLAASRMAVTAPWGTPLTPVMSIFGITGTQPRRSLLFLMIGFGVRSSTADTPEL